MSSGSRPTSVVSRVNVALASRSAVGSAERCEGRVLPWTDHEAWVAPGAGCLRDGKVERHLHATSAKLRQSRRRIAYRPQDEPIEIRELLAAGVATPIRVVPPERERPVRREGGGSGREGTGARTVARDRGLWRSEVREERTEGRPKAEAYRPGVDRLDG